MSQETQQQPPALTAESIAAIVKAAIPQQPQQQQQQRQPTEAEIAKMLNRFDVNEDLAEQLFHPEATKTQRAAALNQILRGVVLEASTMSRYQNEHAMQLILGEVEEPLAFAREYGSEKMFTELYKDNPALKPFDSIVRQLAGTISQDQTFPKSLKERAAFIAKGVSEVIKQSAPTFDPKKGFSDTAPGEGQQSQHGQGEGHEGVMAILGGLKGGQSQENQGQGQGQGGGQTRQPASSSGGYGGGTGGAGAPSKGQGQQNQGGPSDEKPFGF